jgi:hypothetical protein
VPLPTALGSGGLGAGYGLGTALAAAAAAGALGGGGGSADGSGAGGGAGGGLGDENSIDDAAQARWGRDLWVQTASGDVFVRFEEVCVHTALHFLSLYVKDLST